tara:strand:- start:29 stop:577 length:549 start_codon:yes stop_codon:yes gene_type:complete
MSKSLGNVILLDDLLKVHNSAVIRLALLSAHYRQPLNWSDQTIDNANNLYKKFISGISSDSLSAGLYDPEQCVEIQEILSDDLNTPEAINYLAKLAKHARKNKIDQMKLIQSMKFFGLPLNTKGQVKVPLDIELIEKLIIKRDEYRVQKDFKNADAVRDKLMSMGIELKDSDGNTTWNYSAD